MQSTGHSSMHALSRTSTQGCAMTYVTSYSSRARHGSPQACCYLVLPLPGWSFDTGVAMSQNRGTRPLVKVSSSDVGQRVSLRRHLPTGGYSDVVGVLESWAGGTLRVRRRDGELVEVPEDILFAGKVVPPAQPH